MPRRSKASMGARSMASARWKGKSKAQRVAHARMMARASWKVRRKSKNGKRFPRGKEKA